MTTMGIMDGWLPLLAALLLGMVLGGLATAVWAFRRQARLDGEIRTLEARLTAEQERHQARESALEEARERLGQAFENLASKALRENNESFLRLAKENLGKHQSEAKSELSARQKAVEELVKPVAEALKKTEQQLANMEKERKESFGSIRTYLETMEKTQQMLQSETRNLVGALRRPEVRGQWGQLTLRRVVELAGMSQHCDFYEEEHVAGDGEAGSLRPDMVIRMPDQREVVVDAKTPLDAYMDAMEATDDAARDAALTRHVRHVRNRITELAKKSYWAQFERSPEFVVLFIPGEQFLAAALDRDPSLQEDALGQKVILATPSNLMALLKTVAYGWQQTRLAENAETIRSLARDLYHRIATFTEHMGKVGRSLDSSVKHFNRAVGSLDSRVVPAARRFVELGVTSSKSLESLEQIETQPHSVQRDDAEDEDPGQDEDRPGDADPD